MLTRAALTIHLALVGGLGAAGPHDDVRYTSAPAEEHSAEHSATGVAMPDHVGKTFLFDYGAMQIRVRYVSDRKLAWEQTKGPEAGLKAEEEYGFAAIRPGVCFVWWQEKDTSVVTQVVDFEKGVVHTTWLSPEKELSSFRGTVTRLADDPPRK